MRARRALLGSAVLMAFCATAADKPRDLTSRAPKFTFANGLQEQEAQLKENPLMQRFREARRQQTNDPFKPLYHFSSPEAQLNDPNGLCFWQGRWHLFYQAKPPEDGRWHWAINLPGLTAALPSFEKTPLTPDDRYAGPTLFIVGGRSRYVEPRDHAAIHQYFPAAKIEMIADSGHNPHMDRREEFVRLVLNV